MDVVVSCGASRISAYFPLGSASKPLPFRSFRGLLSVALALEPVRAFVFPWTRLALHCGYAAGPVVGIKKLVETFKAPQHFDVKTLGSLFDFPVYIQIDGAELGKAEAVQIFLAPRPELLKMLSVRAFGGCELEWQPGETPVLSLQDAQHDSMLDVLRQRLCLGVRVDEPKIAVPDGSCAAEWLAKSRDDSLSLPLMKKTA